MKNKLMAILDTDVGSPVEILTYTPKKKRRPNIKKQKSTIKVYLDMDGVIADFDEGVRKLTGKGPKEQSQRDMWKAIRGTPTGVSESKFWEQLPPIKNYKNLIRFLEQNFEHVLVLSSPGNGGQATIEGKQDWLTNHEVPFHAIFRRNKEVYAEPNSLLIDDWSKNIEKWKQAGGQTVHYSSYKQAKQQLEELLEREKGRL